MPTTGLGYGSRDTFTRAKVAVPGPGAYNLKDPNAGPKFPFGKSVRASEKPSQVPGPGNYPIAGGIGALPSYERVKSRYDK